MLFVLNPGLVGGGYGTPYGDFLLGAQADSPGVFSTNTASEVTTIYGSPTATPVSLHLRPTNLSKFSSLLSHCIP